jgi:hypothetical protein
VLETYSSVERMHKFSLFSFSYLILSMTQANCKNLTLRGHPVLLPVYYVFMNPCEFLIDQVKSGSVFVSLRQLYADL